MKIGGFVPFSTTDFPGKLAAVIFCQGCTWRCRYCHNPHLQPFEPAIVNWDDTRNFLQSRKGLLDAVVFSGGEPLAQPDLPAALSALREMNFQTGLHTAGACPAALPAVLPLLDWVGLDVKAVPSKYKSVTQVAGSGEHVLQSLQLIADSRVDCEVRTTFHPNLLDETQVLQIADIASSFGIEKFVLQRFRRRGCLDSQLNACETVAPSSRLTSQLQQIFPDFQLR